MTKEFEKALDPKAFLIATDNDNQEVDAAKLETFKAGAHFGRDYGRKEIGPLLKETIAALTEANTLLGYELKQSPKLEQLIAKLDQLRKDVCG